VIAEAGERVRQLVGTAGREALHRIDPAGPLGSRAWGDVPTPAFVVLCIYRTHHAAEVVRLVEQARGMGAAVALWALEAPSPPLAELTIGTGPGGRVDLLNRLLAAVSPDGDDWVAVVDDDVRFVRGDLGRLVRAAATCGFDIAQPAHAPRSHASHRITRTRPLTLGRSTTFVESGPAVVVSPRWRDRVLPLPTGFGMGWGLEIVWSALVADGCRLGIVDGIAIEHLAPAGRSYDAAAEHARSRALMDEHGIDHLSEIKRTLGAWRCWQPRPPWSRVAARAA